MRHFNSTIRVKQKICVSCGKPCYWFSKKRCQQCAKIQSVAEQEEAEAVDELGDLIDELDGIFSKYIRLKYADKDGLCECYTCGKKKKWQEMQCGHYLSRRHMFLRWDERNARPQDEYCNTYKHGNTAVYGIKLEDENPGITDILLEESRIPYKWSRIEIIAMIDDYKRRLKLLNQ
jgi:NinG protein